MTGNWPTTADDITAAWLTTALSTRHPGVDVAMVKIVERHEVTNAHAKLAVTYRNAAGAPPGMFCKLPPNDSRRDSIIATRMGHREARFYAELAPVLPMRVPEVHASLTDTDGMFALLLEDLGSSGCRIPDGTWGIPADCVAGALEDLASLHIRFDDPTRRAAQVPWITMNKPAANTYAATMLRYGLDNHRDRLSDAFAEIAELCITHPRQLQEAWHEGPHTVIHGDAHIGNLFLDGDRVGFLDWGLINVNTPIRDVGYLLTMAMSAEDRRRHERDLLRLYLDLRKAAAVSEISFDEAWRAYRVHASYNVQACCQVVTFPQNASPQRRVFADAFLARAQASLDDLEARAALREVAGL